MVAPEDRGDRRGELSEGEREAIRKKDLWDATLGWMAIALGLAVTWLGVSRLFYWAMGWSQ